MSSISRCCLLLTRCVLYVYTCMHALQVQGIPQLVMLAPDSTVLCGNARGALDNDPNGLEFPWEGAVVQPK